MNGDGLDDVVIGAPGGSPEDEGLATQSGRAYVVFGRRAGGSVDLGRLGRLGIVIEGRRRAVTDAFGWSVDGAGDVDRDGLDDVVIAAPGNPGLRGTRAARRGLSSSTGAGAAGPSASAGWGVAASGSRRPVPAAFGPWLVRATSTATASTT